MAARSSLQNAYSSLSGGFLAAVNGVAARQGYDPFWLMAVMDFETGGKGTFDPAARNPDSSATGLIQFIESTAQGLGTSTAALAQMSRTQQMEYVEAHLAPHAGEIGSLADLYMAVIKPTAVNAPPGHVMYVAGSQEYEENDGLDTNGDGTITKGEATALVRPYLRGGTGTGDTEENPREEPPLPPIATNPSAPSSPAFAGAGKLLAGVLISAALGTLAYELFGRDETDGRRAETPPATIAALND